MPSFFLIIFDYVCFCFCFFLFLIKLAHVFGQRCADPLQQEHKLAAVGVDQVLQRVHVVGFQQADATVEHFKKLAEKEWE